MIFQQDCFPSNKAESPTIIEQNDESPSERAPSFVIEFSHILRGPAKREGGHIATSLFGFLDDIILELRFSKRYIKRATDIKYVTTRDTRELVRHNRLHRILMIGGNAKKGGCDIPYVKDVTKVLQREVYCCEKHYFMFRPEQGKPFFKSGLLRYDHGAHLNMLRGSEKRDREISWRQ